MVKEGGPFEGYGVDAVDEGGEEGQSITQQQLRGWLLGEGRRGAALLLLLRGFGVGEIDSGNEDDASKRSADAEEFAEGKLLRVSEGADNQGEDGGGGGQDGGGGDGGVSEAGHGEVVGKEPEEAEEEGETCGGKEGQVGTFAVGGRV